MVKDTQNLMELIQASQAVDPLVDSHTLRVNHQAAMLLVDKVAKPLKWAGLQAVFANMIHAGDPSYAETCYREALTVFDPVNNKDVWVSANAGLGGLIALSAASDQGAVEEAIERMEIGIVENRYLASMLAMMYQIRLGGDRLENWNRRMQYYAMALEDCDLASQPVEWARANNEVALTWLDQPNGDYSEQSNNRLAGHQASLDALKDRRCSDWIKTQVWLSQAYEYSSTGEEEDNKVLAEACAREALSACDASTSAELHRTALQAVVQALALNRKNITPQIRAEAIGMLDDAVSLLTEDSNPEALADVERSRSSLLHEAIKSGEHDYLPELINSTRRARQLLGKTRPRRSLVLCRIEGEARFCVGDYSGSSKILNEGLNIGHSYLAESTSVDGRMETIHNMGDMAGLACYGLAKSERLEEALVALERGKGLVWNAGDHAVSVSKLHALTPSGGALLFGCFEGSEGLVIIVTEQTITHVVLPNMGKDALMTMQRGARSDQELGGWLFNYMVRRSQPQAWQEAVLNCGQTFYTELWSPVLDRLTELGINPGVELVWFHQGGSSVFPLHAAWTGDDSTPQWLLERYAIRYAPSLKALACGRDAGEYKKILIVSDPIEDLRTEELENAWISAAFENNTPRILRGALASRQLVIDGLADADIMHIATHGTFDIDDPWQSSLVLARGERLTVDDCMRAMKGQAPALVTLGACETAVSRVTRLADEFLGFPAALLHAGTRTVLATLWPVDDRVSAFIAGRFYSQYAAGQTSAEALREAQNWLRTATAAALRKVLKPLCLTHGPATEAAEILSKLKET